MWHLLAKTLIGYTMASVAEDRQHRKRRQHKQTTRYAYRVPVITGNNNMSNLFKKAKRDASLETNYKDRVGGFTPIPTGLYEATIKRAYAVSSAETDAAAVRIELSVQTDDGKTELTETYWVLSAAGETFRVDKRTGERKVIAAWMEMNNLASLATDGEFKFPDLETEDYSYRVEKEGKESFIKTECYPELEGFEVLVAISHRTRYKQVKQGDGNYAYIDETYDTNTVDRFFSIDGFTASELDRELDEPLISSEWETKNEGKVIAQRRPAELDKATRSARGGKDDTSRRPAASGQRKSRFS